MTPLSDALTAAQQRALSALGKAYVGGQVEREAYIEALNACGVNDPVDLAYLLSSLDVLKEWGHAAPSENGARKDETATDAQRSRVRRDLQKLNRPAEEIEAVASEPTLTKARASDLIEAIAGGRYAPAEWVLPF